MRITYSKRNGWWRVSHNGETCVIVPPSYMVAMLGHEGTRPTKQEAMGAIYEVRKQLQAKVNP